MSMGTFITSSTVFKRKFRWMFEINGICGDNPISVLPPLKSARPNLSFKDINVEHVIETITFPGKPEWKTINLTLYDLKMGNHPVFNWIKKLYDPENGTYKMPTNLKKEATLTMLDGCGKEIEKWKFENAYPQSVEFGELDFSSSDYVTVDLTLKYDRAYVQ